jgi:predicted ATPase
MLAEILLSQNEGRAGLELIKRAKSHIEHHEERIWEAEVWRIEGELLRLEGVAQTESENAYRHSLSIARGQGARSFELRTAMSLARLRRDERRNDVARDELAPVLSWFTEGFDSADVQQARNLLNELS